MTPTVDVAFDKADDIEPINALRARTRRTGARVVSVPPLRTSTTILVWSILRALGKRSDTLTQLHSADWPDAARWLQAHGIHTLIVVAAQHLTAEGRRELCDNLARLNINTVLVYGRRTDQRPTISMAELSELPLPPRITRASSKWPTVPKSHPLRFRHDCEQRLPLEQFVAVDELLRDVIERLERVWMWRVDRPTQHEFTQAITILKHGDDPNQRYIRGCAVDVTLLTGGWPIPQPIEIQQVHPRQSSLIRAARHVRPEFAAFHVADAITALPAEHLRLIRGDQLMRGKVLGRSAPTAAYPMLAAMPTELWLETPPDYKAPAREPEPISSLPQPTPFSTVLSRILRQRSHREPVWALESDTVDKLEEFAKLGIVDRLGEAFRMTPIASYSTFGNAERPAARSK